MKSLLFVLQFLIAAAVVAQSEYYFTLNPMEYESGYLSADLCKTRVDHKVKTVTETTIHYKKGRPQEEYIKKVQGVNEKGETILQEEYNSKGRLTLKLNNVINDSGWVEKKTIENGKGKLMYQYDKKFDPETGNVLSYEYRKNNKLKSKYTSTYSGKFLTERVVFKKDGVTIQKRFVYSFNSDMKLQTTWLYDGKEKLMHTWNHECLPEGELLAARKDTTTICRVHEESADGHFVNYLKSVNEKGELTTTTVWYRNERMADSVKVVTEGKHPHTQISKYSEDGKTREYIIIDENNQVTFRNISHTSEKGNMLRYESWNYSKKHGLRCTIRTQSEENAQGLLTKTTTYQLEDLWRETNFSYTYF